MARLEVDNLHATYCSANGNDVLHGVSFGLDEGQSLLVHGHNGSGKSTLLKVLAGLIPATAGSVSWNGSTEPAIRAGQAIRNWMGFQMQAQNVFDGLSIRRNVRLAATGRNLAAWTCEDTVRDNFPLLGALWNKRAGLLSGGQRKVLALAMATLGDPPVLLLDEPMAGLSGESASAVLACLHARKASGTILVVVEHSVGRLGNGLIDRHAEMTEGRLATMKAAGGPELKGNLP